MTEHTPGPWELRANRQEGMYCIRMGSLYAFGLIGEANARLIAAELEHYKDSGILELVATRCTLGEPNAVRLIACWNACEGIETEGLEIGLPDSKEATANVERLGAALDRAQEDLATLDAERDECLKVLREVRHHADDAFGFMDDVHRVLDRREGKS